MNCWYERQCKLLRHSAKTKYPTNCKNVRFYFDSNKKHELSSEVFVEFLQVFVFRYMQVFIGIFFNFYQFLLSSWYFFFEFVSFCLSFVCLFWLALWVQGWGVFCCVLLPTQRVFCHYQWADNTRLPADHTSICVLFSFICS